MSSTTVQALIAKHCDDDYEVEDVACEKECGQRYNAKQRCRVFGLGSDVIMVYLVRWQSAGAGFGYSERFDTEVVPEKVLDIPFYKDSVGDEKVTIKYRFHAAALHTGNPGGGHYTAVVRRGDVFFYINDASVQKVNFDDWAAGRMWGGVNPRQAGYVFFYKRERVSGAEKAAN